MKKIITVVIALALMLSMAGCVSDMNDIIQNSPSIKGIVTEVYDNSFLMIGEPNEMYSTNEEYSISLNVENGVNYDGFKNTSTLKVSSTDEAIERAKNECTVEYDTTTAYYDGGTAMWKVVFSMKGTLGGDQTVYLDKKGITCLVVYGE